VAPVIDRLALPLYRLTARAAPLFLPGMLRKRAIRGKEIQARLPERLGIETAQRPDGRLVWLHAASVGETLSILPVISELLRVAAPPTVLVTTGTVTSAKLLATRLEGMTLSEHVQHRFVPLDVPGWTKRFLDHWRPDVAGFVESEIWPNLLHGCVQRRIPLMLINARLSPKSFYRWRQVPRTARALFGAFDVIQAQSDGDAERLGALLGRSLTSGGNLKFAASPLPANAGELARLTTLLARRAVWLAASTHPGEERQVMAVHQALSGHWPDLLTVIVPRHPDRGTEIAAVSPVTVTRRAAGEGPRSGSGVWVADTLGELGLFYRAIGLAFVGGSLVAHGGQNPLEPARLGCAVAVGPHTGNFTEMVAVLREAGGLDEVEDAAALGVWVDAMLRDPQRRRAMGEAGRAVSRQGEALPGRVASSLLHMADQHRVERA
jgi:3-deoxy-D-manno-octulosonic-acid transferase